MSEFNRGFNLDRIVGWADIARELGDVVLHAITDRHHHQGLSERFITDAVAPEVTAVQRDADQWVAKIDLT